MTDMRDIEDRLRKWHGLYFAEAGPEEPMMMEFLRDVHLAADALSAARKREEELSKLVHMPGMWHCAKCNFTLMQSNLNALDGSITARDNPGDKCPNDGSPLWRVSYRQAYKEMMEIAEQAQVRHRAREEELTAVVEAARRWHAEEWSSKNLKAINAEREGWSKIDGAEAELINALRQLDGGAGGV